MKSQILGLRVASVLFGLITLAQVSPLGDTARGACCRTSVATLAKRACGSDIRQHVYLAVETLSAVAK